MVKLNWKRSALLHRSPQDLFDDSLERLVSIDRVSGATSIEVSEGPVGVGTRVHWTTPYKDLVVSDSLLLTEFQPSRKISTRSTQSYLPAPGSTSTRRYANIEASATTLFEPVPGGTRLQASLHLWITGVNPLWHPVILLANGSSYRKQFHKRWDDMLNRIEGPSAGRRMAAFVRQVWSGWIIYVLVLLSLLMLHTAHEQLGIIGTWLQVVRVVIGLMVAGAILGGYFMASVRTNR